MEDNLENKSSKTLAGIIIANRLLGYNQEQAIKAMQILSTRTDFDYKTYIDNTVKTAPKPKIKGDSTLKNYLNPSNLENIISNILKNNDSR